MFKKSNRNFRQKKAESDDEPDEEEKNALEAAKTVNLARNEEKLKAKVLSFKDEISLGDMDDDGSNEAGGGGDGEEDLGEFKVKKSRESRRIIKEMKKMRREKERQQQQKQEPERADYNVPEPIVYNKNVSGVSVRGGGVTIDSKKEKGKYLVNKYGSGRGGGGGGDEEAENGNGHNQDDDAKSDENQEEEEDHDEKLRVRKSELLNVHLSISK